MKKYRGKKMDNGKWIYGQLLAASDGSRYIIPSDAKLFLPNGSTTLCTVECYPVDPKTVAVEIGMYDKHRTPIYAGDIVKNHMGFEQVVVYEGCCYRFVALLDYIYGERQGETFFACAKKCIDYENNITCDEIIGNIIDNADMVKKPDPDDE